MKNYAYVVCIITVIIFIVVVPMAIYDLITIIDPEFTVPIYSYEQYLEGKLAPNKYQDLLRIRVKQSTPGVIIKTLVALICTALWVGHWQLAKKSPTKS